MKIMFDKYIDNPSGKSTVVTNRSMYKKMYQDKFDKILLRETGRISYKLYKTDTEYFVHFKIPSEIVPEFYYDVVVQFYADNKFKNETNLRRYYVKFYSNDPAFVYTFAHSFIKNNLFIKDLESKMAKQAISDVAKEKNPKNEVWYVKSLYFAYLAMEKYNLFSKLSWVSAAPYDKKKLLKEIMNAEDKITLRQSAGDKIRKQKAEERKREHEKQMRAKSQVQQMGTPHTSRVSSVTKTSRVTNISSRARRTKTTKKI